MFEIYMTVVAVVLIICCCVMVFAFVLDEVFGCWDKAFKIAKAGMCVAGMGVIMRLLGLAYQLVAEL